MVDGFLSRAGVIQLKDNKVMNKAKTRSHKLYFAGAGHVLGKVADGETSRQRDLAQVCIGRGAVGGKSQGQWRQQKNGQKSAEHHTAPTVSGC